MKEPQSNLYVERAVRLLPAVTEERGDPVEALLDCVRVDVQRRGCSGRALACFEVRLEGADEVGTSFGVVSEYWAEAVGYVRLDVYFGGADQSGDAEVVRWLGRLLRS